ncbi:MAG TPA: hypothetical protein VM716_09565 [Gemmatimonadales bacterium]|nr:hypothetical protein [Gemmatimonadales bacterium]
MLLLSAGSASAQDSSEDGFWGYFGLGMGSTTITCSDCTINGHFSGPQWSAQVGTTANPHLRIGLSLDEWWHPGCDKWTKTGTASLLYYPLTLRRGLFLEGGPALATQVVWLNDSTGMEQRGWGFTAGVGYNHMPRKLVLLAPRLAFSYGSVGSAYKSVGSINGFPKKWRHESVSLALGVAWD